jgi:hypothetical protein
MATMKMESWLEGETGEVVEITPEDWPVSVRFHYEYGSPPTGPGVLIGLELSFGRDFSVADVRRLPLATWDRAARGQKEQAATEERQTQLASALAKVRGDLEALGLSPEEAAAVLSGPEAARPGRPKTRDLDQVAAEYRENVRQGLRDPVAAMARTHGVKPNTARKWVWQARKAGLIAPVTGTVARSRRR